MGGGGGDNVDVSIFFASELRRSKCIREKFLYIFIYY